jgi:hypothetical protein
MMKEYLSKAHEMLEQVDDSVDKLALARDLQNIH